jgi:hypothetical protein
MEGIDIFIIPSELHFNAKNKKVLRQAHDEATLPNTKKVSRL